MVEKVKYLGVPTTDRLFRFGKQGERDGGGGRGGILLPSDGCGVRGGRGVLEAAC